ncbi:hypothetical protein BB559_005448 [Furculomyces boomerangus]|uniref:Exocyst complex component Sec3 PIP2-binding N-terminal domain-containing protein n=2 Tax=Harpellales TaxID=61421 RepID=A0A2T9Y8M6_9FUNG|nr:hypothetical protein BB559_005448 [Furculomyces boomerangus]PWA01113.1 hypothetical protein BB558_002835 [Smittium angustum]
MEYDIERVKLLAELLRKKLFVGVEDNPATQALMKNIGNSAKRERLLNLVEVREGESSDSKDNRTWILCLTVKKNRKLRLHRVKQNGSAMTISKQWGLDEIKAIEYKSEREFSLKTSSTNHYRTTNELQTEEFIKKLVSYCNMYSPRPPKYINIVGDLGKGVDFKPEENKTEVLDTAVDLEAVKKGKKPTKKEVLPPVEDEYLAGDFENENLGIDDFNEYGDMQFTSEDLLLDQTFMLNADELLGIFGWKANVDAAELESRLLLELSRLDSMNVRDVLEAEKKVPVVISELEKSISELDVMDKLLKRYRDELDSMGEDVHQIQIENENLKIEEINQQKLLSDLENFLREISVPEEQAQVLKNESLETRDGIARIQKVASILQSKLLLTLEGGLEEMDAFKERKKRYEHYCTNFSARVYDYLKVMFQFKSEEALNNKPKSFGKRIYEISSASRVHEELTMYCGLTLLLKEFKPASDKDLQALYIQSMNKLYNKEGNDLLDSCRPYFLKVRHKEIDYVFTLPQANASGLGQVSIGGRRSSSEFGMGGGNSGGDVGGDIQPYLAFKMGLETIVKSIITEQNFLSDIFHYSPAKRVSSARDRKISEVNEGGKEEKLKMVSFNEWANEGWRPIGDWEVPRLIWNRGGSTKEVGNMLDLLFGNVKASVDNMTDMGTRFDPSQSLGMLAAVEEKVVECKSSDLEFVLRLLESSRSWGGGRGEINDEEENRDSYDSETGNGEQRGSEGAWRGSKRQAGEGGSGCFQESFAGREELGGQRGPERLREQPDCIADEHSYDAGRAGADRGRSFGAGIGGDEAALQDDVGPGTAAAAGLRGAGDTETVWEADRLLRGTGGAEAEGPVAGDSGGIQPGERTKGAGELQPKGGEGADEGAVPASGEAPGGIPAASGSGVGRSGRRNPAEIRRLQQHAGKGLQRRKRLV